MIKKLHVAFLTIMAAFFMVTSTVEASGLRLVKNGDTYYLSTTEENETTTTTTTYTVIEEAATTSAKTATGSAIIGNTNLVPPRGYTDSIGDLLTFLLRIVIVVALLLVLFNLVMAGLQWITSGGDRGKTDAARQRIIAAIVGILVLSAAYALAQLVAYVLGFESFNDIFYSIKRINPS